MKEALIIYPHQLYPEHPGLSRGRAVFLVEDPLYINEFPSHRQKFLLHRLSMDAYARMLASRGYRVTHVRVDSLPTSASIFEQLSGDGYTHFHIADTTDDWLEERITRALDSCGGVRIRYESQLFLLGKQEAMSRYLLSKRRMAAFYRSLRTDLHILVNPHGEPEGGRWSFDTENRKKIPKGMQLPADPAFETNTDMAHAREDLGRVAGEWCGEAQVWFPYTREGALSLLQEFVRERLHNFGPYEDAIESDHARLFHSTLSPVLNIGLITPREVIDVALHEATRTSVPLASLEGFIRQVLGWREFIRAAYERDGRVMRSQNFWKHTRTLSEAHWNGTTGIPPFDQMVHKALRYGYAHHIERLMVAGNLMLLSEIHPHEVYRWFMALFIDAYDWVMVPNVYGMSQFADGGSFATKPYISGSNYLKKMGTFEKGAWEETWDGLYWHFIEKHTDYFASQHRLSMMPNLLAKMDADRRNVLMRSAQQFLSRG